MNDIWGKSQAIEDVFTKDTENKKKNMVQHPKHYNRDGAMECIDEMELIYGPEALMHFCLLSCHKYRYRAGLKNDGYEDLEKSDWYMKKYKELKEKVKNRQSYTISSAPYNVIDCNIVPNTARGL